MEGEMADVTDIPHEMPGDAIVVTGLSGIFPRSESVQEFMENLYNQVDMVDDESRWTVNNPEIPRHVGKVKGMEKFDAQFFKVGYQQARVLEPMSRKLLEHAYGAIFDSGNTPTTLKGKTIGVFIGASYADFSASCMFDVNKYSEFMVGGSSKSMLANRISYWVDGRGPSFCLDYSCASSTAALEQAFKSMRAGDCDAAVVGGCNFVTLSSLSVNLKRSGLLCLDGKTKCFDKNGDGFVRSDAVSLIFLQKAKDAKRVYAELCHIEGTYQLKPDDRFLPIRKSEDLEKFLKHIYLKTDIDPTKIEFVEANGAALVEADENEVKAIAKVFGEDKTVKLGSVKSNMGHSEPASGLCALTKLCLAYHKGQIPANLHCHEPIQSVVDGTVQVVTENTAFGRGYTALNNFSLTGANFHVILKGHYKQKNFEEYKSGIPRLVAISGRQESCVVRILDDLKSKQVDAEEIALLHGIFASDIAGHTGRGYVILDSIAGSTKVVSEKMDYYQGVRPPLWFVFSGMGAQWTSMGADLMRIPTFAKAVQRCDKALAPKGIDIVRVLTEPDDTIFESVINAFVGIAAVQIGFTDILKELGIEPDYIIGHSLGEMACAYHDDTFTTEEMILGTYNRAKAIQETSLVPGAMAAVGLGYRALVSQCPPEVDIACHNSADSCTISGPVDVMKQFVDQLTKRGVFARAVQSANVAYHSRYVADAGPNLFQRLKKVLKNPKTRSPRWVSTSVPRERWDEPAAKYSSAEYHTNNVLNPVLFEEAISLIPSNAVVVEVAPHGLMQAVLKRSHKECTHIPLARRGERNGVNFLLDAIGKLYIAGFNPRVEALYPTVAFPVSTETPLLSHLVEWEHSEDWPMLLDSNNIIEKPISRDVVFSLHDDDYKYLEGHVRNGVIALPDVALLTFVWETLAVYKEADIQHQSVVFTDIQFHREIIVPAEASVKLTVMISKGNESFEVTQDNNLIVSGKVRDVKFLKFHQATQKLSDDIDDTNTGINLSTEDIYKILRMRGFDYKGKFQSIFSSNLNSNKALIKWNEQWVPFLDALIQLNTISKDFNGGVLRPKFIRRLKISVLEQENAKYEWKRGMKCFDAMINNDCGVIRCAGVEIEDIIYSETPLEKSTTTMLKSKEFFPFYPTEEVEIPKATEMNFQIISENCTSKKINITKFVTEQNPIKFDYIDEVAPKVFLANEKTCCIKTIKDGINKASVHNANGTNVYVLQNLLHSSKELTNLHILISENVFILSIEDKVPRLQSPLKDCFTILSCMSDGAKIMILMKKRSKETTTYNPINFDESFSCLTELFEKLQAKKPIVLVSEKQKYCGILGLVQNLKANGHNNISAVVIDDVSAPKFDQNQEFYEEQIQKNITFNILKKGQWGSYYFKSSKEFVQQSSFALKDESEGDVMKLSWIEIPKETTNKTSVQVCYSGLSNSDTYRKRGSDKQFSSIGLDFSGINTNGVKVMGLITGGSVATSVDADPHLTWPVPEHWTLEDAATVPAAHLQAYYCLHIRSQIEKGKSVLILDGLSDVGLALISLCAFYECTILTVVQSAYQKKALHRLHPQLSENNIIISENDSFYSDIMSKTKGEGCDFVINFEAGCIREAATRCVGFFGQFLDFSKSDMYENQSIGMAFLVQSHSYVSVDFMNIFRPEYSRDRKRLQNYITQGIISGAVRPLSRVLYSPLQMEQAVTLLSSHKYIGKVLVDLKHESVANGRDAVPRIQYAPHDVLVVVCDGNGFGVEVADQLVERGAKNILLHLKTRPSGYQRAKFAAWRKREVSWKLSADDVHSEAGAEALLENARSSGKVKGLFVVLDSITGSGKEDFVRAFKTQASVVMNLDVVSRKAIDLSYFVILSPYTESAGDATTLCIAEGVCEARNQMGLPSLVLRHHSLAKLNDHYTKVNKIQPETVAAVFNAIETSLKLKHHSALSLELKKENEDAKKELTTRGMFTFYQHVDAEEDHVTSQEVVELPTLYHTGTEADWNSNDPYIILIPGFEGRPQMFESMAERLKLRAISVKLGPDMEGDSIHDIAVHARKQLKNRLGELKSEKFYILGYSFGANVALELAAILEREGHIGVVHCVDGSPDAMKTIFDVVLGNISKEKLQNVVLNHMHNLITKASDLESDFKTLGIKDERLKTMNEDVNCSIQYKKCVLESACKRIAMVREYNTTIKLKSVVVLMKSSIPLNTEIVDHDYGLSKYTEQPVKVFNLAADHATALHDDRVSNIVNLFADTCVITNNKLRHEA